MTTHDCQEFEPIWQAVLDRELSPETLVESVGCAHCESLAAFAWLLLDSTAKHASSGVTTPAILSEAARRDRRQGRGTLAALLAVAALLLVGIGALTPPRPAVRQIAVVTPKPDAPVRVGDWFSDARASLGELPTFEIPTPAAPAKRTPPGVPAEVAGLPAAARSGFEPIAETTLKAFDYFRREAGLTPRAKS